VYPVKLLLADLSAHVKLPALCGVTVAPHLEVCRHFCESQCSSASKGKYYTVLFAKHEMPHQGE